MMPDANEQCPIIFPRKLPETLDCARVALEGLLNALRSIAGLLVGVCALPLSAGASILLDDDFSKPPFVGGALAGQNGWTQTGASASLPLQISGGKVVIPAGQTADNQDCIKSFATVPPTDASTVAFSFTLTVSSAPTQVSSYFAALDEGSIFHFDNFRFATQQSATGKFKLNTRPTGETTTPYVGGADLDYGTPYRVIGVWTFVGASVGQNPDTWKVYVNPTSPIESNNAPYTQGTSDATFDPGGFDGAVISQFSSSFAGQPQSPAVMLGSVSVANSFAELVPEPGSPLLLAVIAALSCRRSRRLRQGGRRRD
jgi:hypothetical protein